MRYGIRLVPTEGKEMTGYTAKEWVIKERAKDVEHYLTEYEPHAYGSGVHHGVRIDIELERLLQGLLAGHTGRDTQKSAGNKKNAQLQERNVQNQE